MKFRIKGDPRLLTIDSYKGLVHYLSATSANPARDIAKFMNEYAETAKKYRDIDMKSTTVEEFVEGLMEIGDVVKIE